MNDKYHWMRQLNDNKLLTQISIPGTHDSASFHSKIIGLGFTQTQSWNIEEQLNNGVRFLDARCRLINDVFAMHHGSVFLHQFFGDVLNTCLSFLKENPSEFIIISVKKEHSTENSKMDFPEVMREKYIRPNEKYFFTENRIPKLHEIRGKIVLLRRYGGTFLGINALPWKDNATFVLENGEFNIHVQDEYDKYTALTIISKRKPVAHLVKASMNGRSIDMYINFTSLSGALTPYNGAYGDLFTDGMNFWFPKQYRGRHSMGIIVSDYVDINNAAMVNTVINSNFD